MESGRSCEKVKAFPFGHADSRSAEHGSIENEKGDFSRSEKPVNGSLLLYRLYRSDFSALIVKSYKGHLVVAGMVDEINN